jgi:dihydroorotase
MLYCVFLRLSSGIYFLSGWIFMRCLIKNAITYTNGAFTRLDLLIEGNLISRISQDIPADSSCLIYDFSNKFVFPGFADVHVHLREPGFSYKETIRTGTLAAATGGYTVLCSMPNLDPVPDSAANLEVQLEKIRSDAVVDVYPYGAITVGESGLKLSDMEGMAEKVIGFSDDGKGVQQGKVMKEAMKRARALNKLIAAHCEDETLLKGGCVHQGEYAEIHSLKGIVSESEWRQVKRDLELVRETGCAYHVCHVSAKETVELIRLAKAEGLDVSSETAPHYLLLHDMLLSDEGRFKMNPPIRSHEDMLALIEGICDGTVDMIATDHAPHSAEEKSSGLKASLNGITGLECAFPVLYTGLVKTGMVSLESLIDKISLSPKKRFGLPAESGIVEGGRADLTIWDLDAKYTIDSREFQSMGKSTPFDGYRVYGKCLLTMAGGRMVWKNERAIEDLQQRNCE